MPGSGGLDVRALLHFNGTNGAATFTDEKGHTFTAQNGSPVLSNTQSLDGGTSLYLTGDQAIRCITSADLAFPAIWTMEMFVRPDSFPGVRTLWTWGQNADAAERFCYINGSGILITNSSAGSLTATNPLAATTWNHLAWSSDGTNRRQFVAGVLEGSSNTGTGAQSDSRWLQLGSNVSVAGDALPGYYEEWRLIFGTCLYTANFTPPTAPLPSS